METKNLLNKKITQWLLLVAMLVGCSANAANHVVHGNFNNAGWKDYICDSNGYVTITLNKASHEFGVKKNGSDWVTNGGTMKRDNCTAWPLNGSSNTWIDADLAGDYKFRVYNDNGTYRLTVTYPDPEYYVTGDAPGSWGTWYKMTKSEDNIYYYDLPNAGEMKFSDNQNYNDNWYKQFQNSGTLTGVNKSGNIGNNENCKLTLKSGYTTPIRVFINVNTHSIWATATVACTTPTASDFTVTNNEKTYNGSAQTATVSGKSGMGTLTVKYGGSASQTNAGTYAITVDVAAGTTYCAATGISLGNFEIAKASRTISITNSTTTFCQTAASPTVTSSVSAGGSDGTITYTKTGGTATATVNSSTGVITCTVSGTVIVKASISEGTNYEAAESDTKTFTFTPNASIGSVSLTDSEVTVGGSTSATANGVVLGGGTGSWSSSDEDVATIDSDGVITTLAAGTATFTYTITDGCGGTVYETTDALNVVDGCIDPQPGFTVTDDWGSKNFGDNTRSVTLTSASGTDYKYNWWTCSDAECESPHWIEGSYGLTHTAVFTLPGTYYFQSKAGCDQSNLVTSAPKTVTIPAPQIGITGNGVAGSNDKLCYAAGDGDCGSPAGLTWTKEFTVDAYYGYKVVKIHQRYKLTNSGDCSGDDGWSTSNYLLKEQMHIVDSPEGVEVDEGANQIQLGSSFNVGDRARITITMIAYNNYNISIVKTCTQPTSVDITGDWSGNFSDSNHSVDLSASVETDLYQWYTCNSDGTGEQWVEGAYYKPFHREFTLPGKYYFKVKAGCTDASVSSAVKEVDVPFPAMRVEGIIVGGEWVDDYEKYNYDKSKVCTLDMDCNEATYTWTKEFKAASGDTHAFRIGQENKKGAGWTNAKADILGGGQTITTQGDCTNDDDYHFDQTISNPVLAATEKVRVSVIMNAYNNYTVKLERLCGKPYINTWTIPTSAVCEGTEHTIIAEFHSDFGPINSYDWSATGGWTPAQTHTEGYSNTFTAGASNGNITVTAASRCDGSQSQEATSGSITTTPLPSLTLSGVGAKDAAATYPWEYMTVTATAEDGSELNWNDLVIPISGIGANDYVYEQGATANVKKLKSKQTANEDTDKFVISATATKSGCSTTKTYDVYINAAPAEDCGD